jgi:ABC-type glycerol-3-phosphate transport system substrate-binding protein
MDWMLRNTRFRLFCGLPGRVWQRWSAIALLVSAYSLAACGPALGDGTIQADDAIQPSITPAPLPTITPASTSMPTQLVAIWLDWTARELESLYQVIAQYQLNHPEVEFAITYRPRDDLLSVFEAAASVGHGPGILFGPSQWGPGLREQGYILNLSPLLDPGMESDIHAIAWSQAAQASQLLGLPLELHGIVLYRNRTLAAQPVAGLDEWLTTAGQLGTSDIQAIDIDLGLATSLPMTAACGLELFDGRGDLQIFQAGGICWLELLTQVAQLGQVTFNNEADPQPFKDGQVAWLIASSELREELAGAIGMTNLKVDPWPVYDPTGLPLRGFTWSENAYLVAGSTELDLESSWEFLQFLFSPAGQQILSDPSAAAHIPSTSAVEPPDAFMLEASSMLQAGVPLPIRAELTLVEEPLMAAIRAVVLQGSDPAFALRIAEERYQLLQASGKTP